MSDRTGLTTITTPSDASEEQGRAGSRGPQGTKQDGCSHSVPRPPRGPQGDVAVISPLLFLWGIRGYTLLAWEALQQLRTRKGEHRILLFISARRLSSLQCMLLPQGAYAPRFPACPALLSPTLTPPAFMK